MPPSSPDTPRRILLETLANDGRYMSWRRSEHVPDPRSIALQYVDVPTDRARTFGAPSPLRSDREDAVRIPLLPGILKGAHELGPALPSSSLRTVYPDTPMGLDGWALKLHLPDGMRARFAKNLASKEITAADAMIAPLFTNMLQRLDTRSPYLGIIEEPCGVTAQVDFEVGAVFRRLPDVNWIPGFSLYSPNRGRLAKAIGRQPIGSSFVQAAAVNSSGPARIDACLELFVDPLLDIFFSLASQGVTLQMHAQNILFEMDPDTNRTKKVWVRDLAGTNHAPEYRAKRGLDDLLAPAIDAVPGATEALVTAWSHRQGELRQRFEERFLFGFAYDAHLSPFIYQLMTGLWRAGLFGWRDLKIFQIAVQRRAHAAAVHHDFDPGLLRPIAMPREGLLGGVIRGLELRALFRPDPQ